jgi:hypothetical protein
VARLAVLAQSAQTVNDSRFGKITGLAELWDWCQENSERSEEFGGAATYRLEPRRGLPVSTAFVHIFRHVHNTVNMLHGVNIGNPTAFAHSTDIPLESFPVVGKQQTLVLAQHQMLVLVSTHSSCASGHQRLSTHCPRCNRVE